MPLTVRILGSGGAARRHRDAYAQLPDLYKLVDDGAPDLIDICTPNSCHYAQVLEALRSNCHVIVEKPMCGSLTECDRIIDASYLSGRDVFPISQYRFTGHDDVDIAVSGMVSYWRRDQAYWDGWRGSWDDALGGCLTIHGIHLIDLVVQKFGMPFMISAGMDTWLHPERFADIFLGEPGAMIRISVICHPEVQTGGFYLGDSHTGYVEQFKQIHAAITSNVAGPVPLGEVRNVIEVLTAAYWSAYTGEPATLPIGPDHPFFEGWTQHFAQRSQHTLASLKIS